MDKNTPEQKMIHEVTESRPLAIWVIIFVIIFWVFVLRIVGVI